MSEYFLIVSLDDGQGKWEPGTILHVFPVGYNFNPGDVACFHVFRIQTNRTVEEIKAMRCRKVLDLSKLMTNKEKTDKLLQKAEITERVFKKLEKITFHDVTHKPDLVKVIDFDKLKLKDSSMFIEPQVEIPSQDEIERFG